ncbi:MAG: hypothetical protein ACXIUZ_00595 [Lysobacteraceae bacterium]
MTTSDRRTITYVVCLMCLPFLGLLIAHPIYRAWDKRVRERMGYHAYLRANGGIPGLTGAQSLPVLLLTLLLIPGIIGLHLAVAGFVYVMTFPYFM